MNLRVVKIDLSSVERHLDRIATALEGFLEATNPARPLTSLSQLPEEEKMVRSFYTNEDKDIVKEQLHRLGKEYKERK